MNKLKKRKISIFKRKKYLSLLLILCLSIGFAALTVELSIFGGAHFKAGEWKVYFDNVKVLNGSVEGVATPEIDEDRTTVSYVVDLNRPGDYLSFTVDVVNEGGFDAMITNFTNVTKNLEGEVIETPVYLEYTLTYKDGTDIENNHLLEAGKTETYYVTVKYSDHIYAQEDESTLFEITFDYVKADDTAVSRVTKDPKAVCINNTNINVGSGYVCKRAEYLHTEVCDTDEVGSCIDNGHANGDTIFYGNCGEYGSTLKTGDAFTCDVNGDGKFDESTERFYYVSPYYNTNTNEFDSSYATMIYYSNLVDGKANNTKAVAYSADTISYLGPTEAYQHFPTNVEWSNLNLHTSVRQLLNEYGEKIVYGNSSSKQVKLGTFDYGNRAARLLTYQEVANACGSSTSLKRTGTLDSCEFLMQNTRYANSNYRLGYWLETDVYLTYRVHVIRSIYRYVNEIENVEKAGSWGTRPTIDVPISEIYY